VKVPAARHFDAAVEARLIGVTTTRLSSSVGTRSGGRLFPSQPGGQDWLSLRDEVLRQTPHLLSDETDRTALKQVTALYRNPDQ
jgi:hypothetical protein